MHRDHPRVGGEKLQSRFHVLGVLGSPPRGRGKVITPPLLSKPSRITPAWAGKRSARCGRWPGPLDHPRVGGEKPGNGWSFGCSGGSPPRGRGKASPCRSSSSGRRITPAWAGKRHHRAPKRVKRKDHPRVGGEKLTFCLCCGLPQGSPPRGRGKADSPRLLPADTRITPAWAGKRSVCSCFVLRFQDHPRVGGEKPKSKATQTNVTGSPPRGRGKVISFSSGLYSLRITPAWAGKSFYCVF